MSDDGAGGVRRVATRAKVSRTRKKRRALLVSYRMIIRCREERASSEDAFFSLENAFFSREIRHFFLFVPVLAFMPAMPLPLLP